MPRLKLKDIMDARGITQIKMVDMAKVNRATVSKYYHSYGTQFDFVQLKKFANALGVRICDLIDEGDDEVAH